MERYRTGALAQHQLNLLDAWKRCERLATWLADRAELYTDPDSRHLGAELRGRAGEWTRRALDYKAEFEASL